MSALIVHQRQLLGIAKGWAEKHLSGWTDACHRDLIQRYGARTKGGRISATTMSGHQIEDALADYARRGWPRVRSHKAADGKATPVPARIGLLVRLWGKLGQAGRVANPSRPALLAFCARQTGREVRDLDILNPAESQKIAEALKSWLNRPVAGE
jgi:hypothetical protein